MMKEKKRNDDAKLSLNREIGNRVTSLREGRHLTQHGIITRLNLAGIKISKNTYSNYENGLTAIPVSVLVHLGKMFNVSLDYLIIGKKETIDNRVDICREILTLNERQKFRDLLIAIGGGLFTEEDKKKLEELQRIR